MVGWVALDRPEPGHLDVFSTLWVCISESSTPHWQRSLVSTRAAQHFCGCYLCLCRHFQRENAIGNGGKKAKTHAHRLVTQGSQNQAGESLKERGHPLRNRRLWISELVRLGPGPLMISEFLRLFFFLQFDLYTFSSSYPARSRRIFSGQHSASTLPCISIPPFMATPRHRTKFFGTQKGWISVKNGPDAHEGNLHRIR
ncbi:hypothetical protein C8R47DRAFT_1085381 [Mycena vitilis]|nr:hypothetical protein C8R47DRAFT_1085381 [Mycena vitilis]